MRTEESVTNYFAPIWNDKFTKEADLLAKTLEFLNMLPHTKVVRIEAGVKSGIADILVCHYGCFVAIELKDDIGVPSKQQLKFIEDIKDAGGHGAVCRTLAEVYKILKDSWR